MNTVFGKLGGLSGIADDHPFIYCKSEQEHDQHILNVLDTARDNNLQFSTDKFQFKVRQDADGRARCRWSGKMATIVGDVTGLHQREL